ncbi:MAG: DUF4411 family protein [Sulfuricaulis sp.]
MKYCLDASALIDLGERHYPERLKVFAPIWEHLYSGIESGDIISVDYVKIELEKKADDWRKDFLDRANRMFIISNDIESEYAKIIRDIELRDNLNINKHRERFMSGADPWVIALAKNTGESIVVSAETKSLADYGLGPVCNLLGVKHMNLVQFFEANNIGV